MPIYDYSCPECGVVERRAAYFEAEIECACGQQATRLSVYKIGVTGFTKTPVSEREVKIGAFQEAGAELEYQHSRQTNIDGSEAPPPPLWKMAKAEAKRLQGLGVKDSSDLR